MAEREVAEKKALVESWQELIHERREKDAAETLKQAVREKKDTCPELQGIASENEELAKRAKIMSDNIAAAEHHITEFKAAFADLDRDFKDLKSKYEILQATPEIGPSCCSIGPNCGASGSAWKRFDPPNRRWKRPIANS